MSNSTDSNSKPKQLRNSEGEAQAQFRDEDFDFGSKKKQMIGSEGQIISLDEANASDEKTAGQFKAAIGGTEQQQEGAIMNIIPTQVTYYKFNVTFGNKNKWEIKKRYSDFDKLDNRLNDKFGLPPIGLPPKKWFGLSDPELIETRHKMLNAYINDCLKRPVLIHSKELQNFVEMPESVVAIVSKSK